MTHSETVSNSDARVVPFSIMQQLVCQSALKRRHSKIRCSKDFILVPKVH